MGFLDWLLGCVGLVRMLEVEELAAGRDRLLEDLKALRVEYGELDGRVEALLLDCGAKDARIRELSDENVVRGKVIGKLKGERDMLRQRVDVLLAEGSGVC